VHKISSKNGDASQPVEPLKDDNNINPETTVIYTSMIKLERKASQTTV